MEIKKTTIADYREKFKKINENLQHLSAELVADIKNTMLEIATAESATEDEEKELPESQKMVYNCLISSANKEILNAEKIKSEKEISEKTEKENAENAEDTKQRIRLSKYPGLDTPLAYIFGWPSEEVKACREYQDKAADKKKAEKITPNE